jgi:two-component system chemotaxis family response regulator WspR
MLDQPPNTATYSGPMPGVSNRRYFDERFADLLSISRRLHSEVTVLMIDLDLLGPFNERYGRSAGDECLRKVGECIVKSFSRSPDCVARYNEEVFAVVSLGSNKDDMIRHAQRLSERVRELGIPNSGSPHGVLTISIGGVHHLANRDTTEQQLIELANRELLAAKRDGRNCVHIAD